MCGSTGLDQINLCTKGWPQRLRKAASRLARAAACHAAPAAAGTLQHVDESTISHAAWFPELLRDRETKGHLTKWAL